MVPSGTAGVVALKDVDQRLDLMTKRACVVGKPVKAEHQRPSPFLVCDELQSVGFQLDLLAAFHLITPGGIGDSHRYRQVPVDTTATTELLAR